MLKGLMVSLVTVIMAFGASYYPAMYSSIGDRIYIAAEGYSSLLDMGYFKAYHGKLQTFVTDVEHARTVGFSVDAMPNDREARMAYVGMLRQLETDQKRLDTTVLREVKMLALTYNVAVLELLQSNPYDLIRDAATADLSALRSPETMLPPIDLNQSLQLLKSRLLQLRETDSAKQHCFNDVTAVNYWMLASQQKAQKEQWCDALEATAHIKTFEASARHHCGDEEPLYIEWKKRSMPYRTDLRQEFGHHCR